MNSEKTLTAFKAHVAKWKELVMKYKLEELSRKPNDTSWSLGQVCYHVIKVHEVFYMKHAWQCLNKEEGTTQWGGSKNFMGRVIFFFRSIPPVKIKMPESHAFEPPQPESKNQLISDFDKMVKQMDELYAQLPKADLNIRSKHPLLDMLNAWEWFQGAEFHAKHHFLQARRIEKFLERR
ncbi:MAG: DinB family protein [Cryomorphaceae bacterium]|nr:MAG: DinB family protein [Cryomorphaceae bacterium]